MARWRRDWNESQNRYMDMTELLRSAMSHNPNLKILVNIGYDPTFTDRVSFTYYEAGHMIYIRPSEHKKLKADIAQFIAGTRGKT